MGTILPEFTYRKLIRVRRNQNITRVQMDGEIVDVSEGRVRKAVRELKNGNHVDQKEFMLKC
jgi:hypothetical protein